MKQNKEQHTTTSLQRGVKLFKARGGILRTMEAMRGGVHPRTLYAMRDAGIIKKLDRGVYHLTGSPEPGNPDLSLVARKVPKGVVCLISALSFHSLTTQIPREVYLAIPRGAEPPRMSHPPLRIVHMGESAFDAGIQTHQIDNVGVRIYCAEKTIADCFKFRNKIGLDTAVEALRLYRDRRKAIVADLLRYASVCRVSNVMRPYLEALL